MTALTVTAVPVLFPATAVHAGEPRADEWWFPIWGITDAVWPHGKGKGVIVAVLDSGVNGDLPSLRGAVLPGKDFSAGKPRNPHSQVDPNHGTAMASLIAGRGTGPDRFYGVAPEAKILPIVRYRTPKTGGSLDGFKDLAEQIRWAVDNGADIINMSFLAGTSAYVDHCEDKAQEAVSYAIEHDVILVTAAGNDAHVLENTHEVPGVCAGVITVGGMAKDFRTWKKTRPLKYTTFAAPAVDVPALEANGKVRSADGTSNSAALVSGLFALLRGALPDVPSRELVRRVIATTADAYQPGWDTRTGYGVPVIDALIQGKIPPPSANKPYDLYDKWKSTTSTPSSPQASPPTTPPTPDALPPSSSDKGGARTPLMAAGGAVAALAIAIAAIALKRRARPHPQDQ